MSKSTMVFVFTVISSLLLTLSGYALCENEKRQIKDLEKQLAQEQATSATKAQQINVLQDEVRTLKDQAKRSGRTAQYFNLAVGTAIVATIGMFLVGIALGSKARKDSQLIKKEEV